MQGFFEHLKSRKKRAFVTSEWRDNEQSKEQIFERYRVVLKQQFQIVGWLADLHDRSTSAFTIDI
ncbi:MULTISPECIES: hypothetical protein [unclassified Pseudovibrio]|uniref:hypothetical protein n=1 Tax=unclassified Pseudovibrio TaxID=2627060 RepID=UPI0007AECA33|nr:MULTISPECIES: hypothetical protein [unclassified Pseudovibrio]KZL22973.1 hypothetical protein PsWM33_03157 [Pseudovibrio sp. WM33]KZL26212.1 hypothetical protein PsAD37_02044 [Pseudovibrio sp. Ad37]